MHIYKYVLLHVIILHQHISVTLVTIRVSYKNNAIIIKIIVQKYTIKPFAITFDIFKRILWS